jgi:hypothetical protein
MLGLAGRPDAVAAMRRALREAELTALASLQEVVRLLNLDPAVLGNGGLEAADLSALAARFGRMASATDRYASWAQLARLHKTLVRAGVPNLAERMRSGDLDGS